MNTLTISATLLTTCLLFSTTPAFSKRVVAQANSATVTLTSERTLAQAPTSPTPVHLEFSDISADYWANPYLSGLFELGIISGFPDGTFRPSQPVTRAEFTAILNKAFSQPSGSSALPFDDVSEDYWATQAIQSARAANFLSGYPGNLFRPQQPIPRVQAIVALASGLGYSSSDTRSVDYFTDARSIPFYALKAVAGATEASAVVSYPNSDELSPNRQATRAEVAALVYQSMVQAGKAQPLSEPLERLFITAPEWKLEPIARIEQDDAIALSLSNSGRRLLVVKPAALQVWEVQSSRLISEVATDDEFAIKSTALNHAGTQIGAVVYDSDKSTLQLRRWSAETGESAGQIQSLSTPEEVTPGLASYSALTYSPSDDSILTQVALPDDFAERSPEFVMRLHDSDTGETTETLESISGGIQLPELVFSPDGMLIATVGDNPELGNSPRSLVKMWEDGRFTLFVFASRGIQGSEPYNITDIAFNSDNELVVLSDDGYGSALRDIWGDTGVTRTTDIRHLDRQDGIFRLSPRGDYYFIRGDVAGTRIINLDRNTATRLDAYVKHVAFSGNSKRLVLSTLNDIQVFEQN